jgi:hypothetical protein
MIPSARSYYRFTYLGGGDFTSSSEERSWRVSRDLRVITVQLGTLVVHAIVEMNAIDSEAILATDTLAAGVVSTGD